MLSGQKPNEPFDKNTSMATKDLLINNGCNRQTVEAVGEGLPQLYVVSPLTCQRHTTINRLQSNLETNKITTVTPIASHSNIRHRTFYIILALSKAQRGM